MDPCVLQSAKFHIHFDFFLHLLYWIVSKRSQSHITELTSSAASSHYLHLAVHAWTYDVRNLINCGLVPTMYESTMILFSILEKFLNFNFEFCPLKRIGNVHFSINKGVEKFTSVSVNFWPNST